MTHFVGPHKHCCSTLVTVSVSKYECATQERPTTRGNTWTTPLIVATPFKARHMLHYVGFLMCMLPDPLQVLAIGSAQTAVNSWKFRWDHRS